MNYFPNFKYYDVGVPKKTKWKRVVSEDVEKHRARLKNRDFCKTVARYANEQPQDVEPKLMGISIDLDNDNFEVVLSEACGLLHYFYTYFDLKKEEVRFYYSGNRSIHIVIQPETLGICPHEKLHIYIREVVRIIADKLDLENIDYHLYAKRQLFRCEGTRHGKTGRYKVEISPEELILPPEEIEKLGENQRNSLYEEDELELSKNEAAAKCFNELFEMVRKGVEESDYRANSTELSSIIRGLKNFPVCVQDLLENNIREKGTRNRATLTLVSFLKDAGRPPQEIEAILIPWAKAMPLSLTSADEAKRTAHVKDMVAYVFSEAGSEYHFACPFILSLGSKDKRIKCTTRCQLRLKEAARKEINVDGKLVIPTAYLPEIDGHLVELIYDPETKEGSFAVYNLQTKQVRHEDVISFRYPTFYVPLIDDNVRKGVILFPSMAEEYGTDEALYQEVGRFISKYYHEPDRKHRTLNTLYVFFTWVYDRFRSWAYLQFLGKSGGGKSRGQESIGYICYRPMKLGGGDSSASIFRLQDTYRGTTLIDEATFSSRSEAHQSIVQVLNVGYKIDGTIGRCEGDVHNPVRYMVGSPKILATRIDFYDDGLRSRCIVRRTGKDNRVKTGENSQPVVLPDSFYDEALSLRNKLLLWRFRHWKDSKIDLTVEIKGVESRINEIIVPILSVMKFPSITEDIEALAKEQQDDLKQHRQATLEGEVLKAIQEIGLISADISPSEIASVINKNRLDKPFTTNSITKALKRMELKLHQYANKWMLTNCPENKESLVGLYEDYGLVN